MKHKITCDYCGGLFDIEGNHVCPYCGGKYETDKEYTDAKAVVTKDEAALSRLAIAENEFHKNRALHLESENRRILEEVRIKQEERESRRNYLLPFKLTFIVVAIIIIVGFFGRYYFNESGSTESKTSYTKPTRTPTQAPVFIKSEAGFNEPCSNGTIEVTVDLMEEQDPYTLSVSSGYKVVRFHFIVENLMSQTYRDENYVRVTANGITCDAVRRTFGYKDLEEQNIVSNGKIEGNLFFQVPTGTKELVLKYGDYITLKLPNVVYEETKKKKEQTEQKEQTEPEEQTETTETEKKEQTEGV